MVLPEPIHDVAHLAHVELLTPNLDESARFFVDIMGMVESGRRGDSVYLRGWDDYEHHSLQLTAAEKPGLGHYAFRAASPQALQRRVAALEGSGLGRCISGAPCSLTLHLIFPLSPCLGFLSRGKSSHRQNTKPINGFLAEHICLERPRAHDNRHSSSS